MLPHILKDNVEDVFKNIIDALNAGLSILDKDLHIIWSNKILSDMLNLKYNPIGKACYDVYKCGCSDITNCSALKMLSHGERQCSEIQLITEKGERQYIKNISVPIRDGKDNIISLIRFSIDVTEKEEKIRQLSLLRKLSELMHGTLQIDRLLHLILTCVTAGTALGFNRSRLFLVDKERNIVYGKMAVGPSTWEEAYKIWGEIANKYERLEDLIRASEDNYRDDTPLHMITRLMAYSLTDEKELIVSCIKSKKPILEKNAFYNPNINKKFVSMIDANEFVCVPLIVKEEAIGVICADNFYSCKPITEEHVQLLSTFASQAALAIENAEAYKKLGEKIQQLGETQERLIRSERLAVIGNMAAYIAHEIRNPLVTIGGFARAILRTPDQDNQTRQSIEVIVEEVKRLEKILANIMDFSKPYEPVKILSQINEILENTCSLMESYFKSGNIQLTKKLDTKIPKIIMDSTQMKQVFLNIIKNAVESMPDGGMLTVETMTEGKYIKINIIDRGKGMNAKTMKNIFTPFFTTKMDGTGVGLAVSQKIVDDHGGYIKVNSSLSEGTTFSIYLPVKKEQP
ncbi:MAG: Signal transduction histidine kinase [Candidatus Jettenia ecosi]|uniref:histidine kinase n=1 Tax=Candidatus Jettenia ecosi TaxID=2494326 RepID=A0A533Q6N5_9BACT|nr:MAG: Signal transduction histidine kinase [Candidatus Jettenia ecosi]